MQLLLLTPFVTPPRGACPRTVTVARESNKAILRQIFWSFSANSCSACAFQSFVSKALNIRWELAENMTQIVFS